MYAGLFNHFGDHIVSNELVEVEYQKSPENNMDMQREYIRVILD